MRSFRAEKVSGFVKAVLDGERNDAQQLFDEFHSRYPVVLSRDLNAARRWIRARARGTERTGLVASSQAMRLKPHAIDVRLSINPVHYFLDDATDTRASSFLESTTTSPDPGPRARLGMRELGRRSSAHEWWLVAPLVPW